MLLLAVWIGRAADESPRQCRPSSCVGSRDSLGVIGTMQLLMVTALASATPLSHRLQMPLAPHSCHRLVQRLTTVHPQSAHPLARGRQCCVFVRGHHQDHIRCAERTVASISLRCYSMIETTMLDADWRHTPCAYLRGIVGWLRGCFVAPELNTHTKRHRVLCACGLSVPPTMQSLR